MNTQRVWSKLLFITVTLLFAGSTGASAQAAFFGDDAVGSFGQGLIQDIVHTSSGYTIVGGAFGNVGPPIGKRVEEASLARGSAVGQGVTAAARETASNVSVSQAEGSIVSAMVPDGSGGLFIGGLFNEVEGVAVSHIAHIRSDGKIDDWTPDFDDTVRDMVLYQSSDDTVLIVAGEFTRAGGAPRDYIAAYRVKDDGSIALLPNFDPDPDSRVTSLHISGKTLFFGGNFTSVLDGGKPIDHVAAMDISSFDNPKIYDGFDPGLNGTVETLTTHGDYLYVGGSFKSAINGLKNIGYVAAFDVANPDKTVFVDSFDLGVNALVYELLVHDKMLYVGGDFTLVDGDAAQSYLASFDVADGANPKLSGFKPVLGPAGAPGQGAIPVDMEVYSDVLYIGGSFKHLAGGAVQQKYAAAYDISNPHATVVMANFRPVVRGIVHDIYVDAGSGKVLMGNGIDATVYLQQANLAVFDADGNPVPLTVDVSGAGTQVTDLELWEVGNIRILFVAGSFRKATGASRDYVAAYHVNADGTLALVNGFDLEIDDSIFALARKGTTLYLGGEFETIEGEARGYGASLDITNIGNPQLRDFNPNFDGSILGLQTYADQLYISGTYNDPGGRHEAIIQAYDVSDPDDATAHRMNLLFNKAVTSMYVHNDRLYAGGGFWVVTEALIPRTLLAGFNVTDPDNPTILPGFNPNLSVVNADVPQNEVFVGDMMVHDDVLYVVGAFDRARGAPVSNVVAYDLRNTSKTTLADFTPRPEAKMSAVSVGSVDGQTRVAIGGFMLNVVNDLLDYSAVSLEEDNFGLDANPDEEEQQADPDDDAQADEEENDDQEADEAQENAGDANVEDDEQDDNSANNNQVSDGSRVTREEVILQIDPPDGDEEPTQMAISNNADFAGASFIPFARSADWVLPEGAGEKKVYIRFRYADGRTVDEVYTVQFVLDDGEEEEIEVSCPLEIGQAYKSPASAAVWFIGTNPDASDPTVCYKRAFNHARTFFTYFEDWSVVKNTSQSKLNQIAQDPLGFMPAGPLYDPKFGALVKHPFDPKVYLILGDTKYWITSEEVFNTLNYQWNWIEDVHPDFIKKYKVGSEIDYLDHHPNYTLVKYDGDPKVYRLEPHPTQAGKQVKRYIPNEEVFNALQFRFDRIVTLDTAEDYETGDDLLSL